MSCRPQPVQYFFLEDDRNEHESHCKLFGVFIDESLNFGKHVENVLGELSKKYSYLIQNKRFIMDARLDLYYAVRVP